MRTISNYYFPLPRDSKKFIKLQVFILVLEGRYSQLQWLQGEPCMAGLSKRKLPMESLSRVPLRCKKMLGQLNFTVQKHRLDFINDAN